MKVIDCFIFYNELDMLEVRMNELNSAVDYFVIVEATRTFRNNPKPLYYKNNKERFSEYADKIIHVVVEDMNRVANNAWHRENHQRDSIKCGLEQLRRSNNINDVDLVIISDIDEIPDKNAIKQCKNDNISDVCALNMDFYYYNITCKLKVPWSVTKIVPYGVFRTKFHSEARHVRGAPLNYVIKRGGWHLSYFGNASFIINKIQQFSHSEYDKPEYLDIERIENRIQTCTDIFQRQGINLDKIPIEENSYLPDSITLIQKYFGRNSQ